MSHEPFRKPLLVANWKMNKTIPETENFIKSFLPKLPHSLDREAVLCPPFTALAAAKNLLQGSTVQLGAQNVSEQDNGAFTGEISPSMLVSVGCQWVILGHSERREYQRESDGLIKKKIVAARKAGLKPIICVGEKLEEREAKKTMDVVIPQVKAAVEDMPSTETKSLVFAYEPIWAIGTGKTATPAQAQEVHLAIRDTLKELYGSQTSLMVRILYGGSIKPDNITDLMACEDIDGGLVGGASLDPESFIKIVLFDDKTLAKK